MQSLWTHSLRVICVLFALLGPLAASAQAPDRDPVAAPTAPPIANQEFRDQFGHTSSLANQRGTPAIVVIVTVARLAMIEPWERDLHERVPEVRFMNVADLPSGVPVDLDRTAATLRKRVPPGVAVLMDPARQWATTYGLDTALPNLLLFDAGGQLTGRFRGRWTADLGAQVAAAIAAVNPGQGATP
jgi:hypothetical protein